MTIQRNSSVLVAIRRETAINVQATATGAIQMRILDSPGMDLKRAQIASAEKRTDLLMSMPRLGYKTVDGSFNTEATVGGHTDLLLEAINRSVWATATAIGFASMTITLASNAITAGSGSFITNGVRTGDIFTISGTSVSADNGLNVRALAVTTSTIVVATGTYVTLTAAATGTLTILKKLTSPASPTRYSHTIEQYDSDIDVSELITGARCVGAKISMKPGQPVTIAYTFLAADRTALATGASPYFTTPSLTTGLALICEDSSLRYNGTVAAQFTGFDLSFDITAAGQPVIGSTTTPDIFDNDLAVTGTITGLRSDFSNLTLLDAETEFALSIKLEEPNTGPPKSCLSFYLPRVKLGAVTAPVGGGDGPKVETLELMVGPKVATSVDDAGVVTIHSSAA